MNDPPTITAVDDQRILAGETTGALSFEIGDEETALDSLSLDGASDNARVRPWT